MGHSSIGFVLRMVLASALSVAGIDAVQAQPGGGSGPGSGQPPGGPRGSGNQTDSPNAGGAHGGSQHGGGTWGPVYQRKAFDWKHGPDKRKDNFRHKVRPFFPQAVGPSVQSGWFTRPYPYHLDYYKMKYGGSYAPYFGNLYGPPQVVTAPPYYGPYYGGWGWPEGFGGADGVPADPSGYPAGPVWQGPVEGAAPDGQPAMQQGGEGLPSPQ